MRHLMTRKSSLFTSIGSVLDSLSAYALVIVLVEKVYIEIRTENRHHKDVKSTKYSLSSGYSEALFLATRNASSTAFAARRSLESAF
jgi:hypothetical protein